jgi:predicted N-acetyltransferase YhbS
MPKGFSQMRIRIMTKQDIPAGLRLNTLSGWNQTSADWERFLVSSPRGCFVMEDGNKVVGTAATICYENRFAWIGMVLVDPEYRKQGIGTQLLNKTIEHLDHSNISTIKLDATPLGKPLYAKLGFISEFEIERWVLKRPPGTISTIPSTPPAPMTEDQQQEIFTLDRKCFGADRSFLLRSLFDQAPELAITAWQNGVPLCFAFGRYGLFADHVGPCMATSRVAAENLLREFLTRSSRDILIVDCIKSNPGVVESLAALGFVPSRPLTRMVRGPNAYPGRPDSLWAILGPEFG